MPILEKQGSKNASVVEKLYSQIFIWLSSYAVLPFFDNRKSLLVAGRDDTLLNIIGLLFRAALVEKEVQRQAAAIELKQKIIVIDKNKIIINRMT